MQEKLSQFTPKTSGVDAWQTSKINEDINNTREEALSSTIAGLHYPDTPTTYKTQEPENPYEIQREVLSSLSLLDQDLNPTDTYTNYYNKTKSIPPSYANYHDQLLFLDKVDQKTSDYETGLISEEQMLWDLYGQDLLEASGYNVRSVGWWQNKYYNNDFTSPLDNHLITQSITSQAREQYAALQAKRYEQTKKVKDSHLNTLLSKGDLSNQDIKTLFPELTKAIKETQNSTNYTEFITSNKVSATSRIHTTETGDRYYLHTDGELYKLSNEESGQKIASFTEDADNQITSISINNSDVLDVANSFKAGAASILSSLTQLGGAIWGATGGYIIGGLNDNDWNWVNSIADASNAVTSFNNDNLAAVFDSYYVDLDGFKTNDTKDWAILASTTLGAMVSGVATGAGAKALATKGASLASTATNPISKALGRTAQIAGNLYARSTGHYKGYTDQAINIGSWGLHANHLKTVGTYMMKDFTNNIQTLQNQHTQLALADYMRDPNSYDPEKWSDDSSSILGYATLNTVVNGFISAILAGGIDDNQTMRWSDILYKGGDSLAGMNLQNIGQHLMKYKITYNTAADFLDNFLTMYSSNAMGYDQETGSIKWNENAGWDIATRTAVQAAIQTLPTLSANLQSRNIAAENLEAINQRFINKLIEAEEKANDPQAKASIRTVRLNHLKKIEDTKSVTINGVIQAPTPAQRIASALDYSQKMLQDSTIPKIIDEICIPSTIKMFRDANEIAIGEYRAFLDKRTKLQKSAEKGGTKGIFSALKNFIKENYEKNWTKTGAVINYAKDLERSYEFVDKLYDTYLTVTDSKDSATRSEKVAARINTLTGAIEDVKESYSGYDYLVSRHKNIKEVTDKAIATYADTYNLKPEDVKAASMFVRLKNETKSRAEFQAETAAMVLLDRVAPYAYYKIDDYTYGIVAMDSEVSKLFHTDTAAKFSIAMRGLATNDKQIRRDSIELMISTMVGDEAVKNFKRGKYNKAATKETLTIILDTAISQGVLTKAQAADVITEFGETDSEIGKAISSVFETAVNAKNVNELKNMTDLEKYTLIRNSILHLQNPENKRFSGKTIAAEAMLQQEYDTVTLEVLGDMHDLLPENVRKSYVKAVEKQLFPQATDSIKKHLTNVIGKNNIDDIKTESDVIPYLKSLAKDASDYAVHQAAKDLLELINLLKSYRAKEYKGDSVTLNFRAWSNEGYRRMLNDIKNTDSSLQGTKNFEGMTERDTNKLLNIQKKYKGKNINIKLTDDNMSKINDLYDLLVSGGFIDSIVPRPTSAEGMKTILTTELNDEGRAFATYKNSTEYDSGIITDKESKLIQDKLRTFSIPELIDTVTVLDRRTGNAMAYDYYTMIGSNIKVSKISEKMSGLMRRNTEADIYINPVNIATLGVETNGAVKFYYKKSKNIEEKQGRIAGSASQLQSAINTDAEAAMVNKDLSMAMMIDTYIDFVDKNRTNLRIVVPAESLAKLYELGIVSNNKDDVNAFYEVSPTYSLVKDSKDKSHVTLQLRPGVTKEMMQYAMLHDENPNVFKILPFVSNENVPHEIPMVAPEGTKLDFIPDITGGITSDLVGLYSVLNITFDYDQTGKLRENFIKDLFAKAQDGSFKFNPYSEMRKPIAIDSYDEFLNYRKNENLKDGINDPYYDLISVYKELNDRYISKDDTNDDYKLWLKSGNVLKKMIKHVESNGEADASFIKDIVKTYEDATIDSTLVPYKDAGYHYDSISTASKFNSAINIDADTAMSKDLLDASVGIEYQLVENGKPYEGYADDIKKAYDYVKENINFLKDIDEITSSPYALGDTYTVYKPTDIASIWSILSASEGSITIEDLDKLTRLEADAYNEFFARLGFNSGYGSTIKQEVDTMYDKLRKLITGTERRTYKISNKRSVEYRAGSAVPSETPQTVATNIKSKKDKQLIKNLGESFVGEELDNPEITQQRLVDVAADNTRIFEDTYRDYASARDEYTTKVLQQIAKTQINDNNDYRRQSLIPNISSDINLNKIVNTTRNTHESIVKELKLNPNKDMDNNLIEYSATLTQRMSGTRYLSNYAKYSFLDLNSGKEYAMATTQKINGNQSELDLLLTLADDNKTASDWVGKAFISLNKHDSDNPNGLTYSYKIINTETDYINLKNDVIYNILQQNKFMFNNTEGKTLLEKIHNLSDTEFTNLMNRIINEGIGIRDKETLLNNALSKTNINEIWKYKIMPVDYKADINKETIRDVMGTGISALMSADEGTRRIANAIIFGIDYEGFDEEHRVYADKVLDYFVERINTLNGNSFINKNNDDINDIEYRINTGNKLTSTELSRYRNLYDVKEDMFEVTKDGTQTQKINKTSSIYNAIRKYIVRNFKNSEVLDYFFNSRRTLQDRYDSYINGYSDTYKITSIEGSNKELSINDIRNFYNNDASTLNKVMYIDTEGSNKIKASGETADSIKDLFQISIITDEIIKGKLVSKQETYFIKHDEDFAKWVEENIDYNDNFYNEHVDYQKIIEEYKNLTGNESNVLTESQVFDLLNGRQSYKPDLIVAYNGDNYEFRVLKNGLDSEINTLDAISAVMKRESDTTKSIDQDKMYKQYKRNFGDDYSDERHTADQDTADMHEMLTKDYFVSDYAISEDRSKLIKDLLNLVPDTYKQDNELMIRFFTEVDRSLGNNKELKEYLKHFNQYTPTLDNIKELQRSYNYMANNARGNVFFKLREQLGYDTVYGRLVSDNTSKYNFVDVLATKMVETNGDAEKALGYLWSSYKKEMLRLEEQPSTQDLVEKLMSKDSETLRVLGIDEERFNSEDVVNYKKQLINQFKEGLDGFDNGKILNISKNIARDFRDTEYITPYITAAETLALKNKGVLDENSLNLMLDFMAKSPISIVEDGDIKLINDYINTSIKYNDAGVKQLELEIKNILNKNIGTGTFRGLYSMMSSVDPISNDLLWEIDPVSNTRTGKLENVKAGDIVITMNAMRQLLNVYDISELAHYDNDGNITGYYLMSITNPADNMNSILPLRVRVIDDNEHVTVGFTPETQEILRNRDFDGDHTITTVLPKGAKEIAPLLNDYIFNIYTAYSKIANMLSKTPGTTASSLKNAYIQRICSNDKVFELCLKLDSILNKYKDDITLGEKATKEIDDVKGKLFKAIKNSEEFKEAKPRLSIIGDEEETEFIDDIIKTIGIKEMFTNTSDVYRLVNNPSLYNYKDADGNYSYTHGVRQSRFSRGTLNSSNKVDSIIGLYQKLLNIENIEGKQINKPLEDLYTPSIYMTDSVAKDIENTVTDYNSYLKYIDDVYKIVSSETTSNTFKNYINNIKKTIITDIPDNADAELYATKAKQDTMNLLWELELYTKSSNSINNKFSKVLDIISKDDTFEKQLKVTKDLDNKLTELSNKTKSLYSKHNKYTPLSDSLLESTIDDIMKSPEDSNIILKDNISNGANKVNIFITKGFLGNAPDDIAQVSTSKAASAVFDIFNREGVDYDIPLLKSTNFIEKGTIIGTKGSKNIRAARDMYINKITDDYILVNYKESLTGKKVGGAGLFKGIVKETSRLIGEGADSIDFIVDANNSTKNFDKYSQGTDFLNLWKNAEYVKYKNAKGEEFEGFVLKDVPFNIIGDDLSYTQKLDLNDPSNIRRFEVMASDGAFGLLNIGRYGSTVLKKDRDGKYYLDFTEVSKALQQNFDSHDVTWTDAGSLVMYLRSAALVNSLTEEEFKGLSDSYMANQYESRSDYLTNLRNSPEKINSEASLLEQNLMIRMLGKERYNTLYKTSPLMSYIFGYEVNGKLNPLGSTTFKEDFYNDIKSPHSKNSGKKEMEKYSIKSKGTYINASSRDVNDRRLIQSSYLHIPYDQFYRGITGRFINQDDILRAVQSGILGYTKHFKNSAMIENDFTPVDINMGTRLDPVINKNITSGVIKTGIPGENDIFKVSDTTMNAFQKGSGTRDVFYGYEDPSKPTFNSMMAKAMDIGHVLTGYDLKTKIGYMMAVAFDKNKNNLERMGILNGKDSVIVNKLTSQFINDKDKISYVRVHDNKKVSLKEAQKYINEGTKGYMLRKDVKDSIDKHKFTKDEMKQFKKSGVLEADVELNKQIKESKMDKAKAYKNLVASLESMNSDITNNNLKFTWDVSNSTEEYKNALWTRSGIDIKNAEQLSVDVGIKNYIAGAEYTKNELTGYLENLRSLIIKSNTEDFENFAKYRWLQASAESDPQGYDIRAKYMGVKDLTEMPTLKKAHDEFVSNNPQVVKAYETYIDRIIELAKEVSKSRNEPFDSYYLIFAPYVSRNKDTRYNVTLSNIRTMMGLNKYDPTSKRNALEQNMMFDFFEGSKRIIDDLSKAKAADNISEALLGNYLSDGKSLINNKAILDKAFEIIDTEDTFSDLKLYNDFDSEVSKEVLNVVSLYTDLNTYRLKNTSKNGNELLINAYRGLRYEVEDLRSDFEEQTGERATLSNVYYIANESQEYNYTTRLLAKKTADAMWAEIVVAQRIIESSSKASNKLVKYISGLEEEGYVLVNRFGQKIKRNGEIAPITDASLSYIKDNVELTMNSRSDTMFAQYVLEKALSGEIYLCRQDLADQLESKVYTSKVPGRVMKTLIKASKTAAGFQMALPAKLLSRFLRFTGFDYAMGAIGNLETIPNISRASKEISAALQSNGKSITQDSDLYGYLIRQGQPSLGGLPFSKKSQASGLDPINFADTLDDTAINKFTSEMTKPLELQNHLGRYAIYLTAKESFDEGKPWYGSQYYNHEYIDKLDSNEDKAMYVMDYMLGSNGGFPYLSKKTAGLMMYSTFPMNLTRTMGAYGMSMLKLFQEGVTSENANQWFNTIIMPSLGIAGISVLSNAIISAICDAYGVDEEKEEEWKREGVTLDPIGTLIGGTPTVVYDSINPAYTLKEMYINPFTNKYNDTLPKKAYGFVKANMLSKLNPLLKLPIEIVTGEDLWGDSASGYKTANPLYDQTKKYQYSTIENGMKKVLGYFVGSGVADSIIDQQKIADINDDSNFIQTLWKGFTKGLSNDLGNQKSWKKDTSNYYSFITDIKAFDNKDSNSGYYLDIEDMADAEELYYNRNYANQYGEFDKQDYNRVSATLKKYINNHESETTIYNYIVKEYNENNVSEATMRAALNNNSLARRIKKLDNYQEYLNTLTTDEKIRLQKALEYEQETYPMLEKLFPDDYKDNTYTPYYKWSGYSGGTGSNGYSTPRYYNYYPGKYYPKTFYYNKKLGNYSKYNPDRVSVNVSPQMGIWNQDYNLTQYETGIQSENEPKWLRDKGYVNRTN